MGVDQSPCMPRAGGSNPIIIGRLHPIVLILKDFIIDHERKEMIVYPKIAYKCPRHNKPYQSSSQQRNYRDE